jgi:hypothetical protein
MQLLLDHLFAVVAGAILLLSVLFLRNERSEEVRDSTRYYVAKNYQTTLADMVQRDLLNLGTDMPPGQPMIIGWNPDSVSFYSAINGVGGPQLITYRRRPTGTTLGGTQIYEIERFVGVGLGRQYTGTGLLVSRFEIEFADEAGSPVPVADADLARIATVRIENVLPFDAREAGGGLHLMTPHRNYWEATYRPPNLAHGW